NRLQCFCMSSIEPSPRRGIQAIHAVLIAAIAGVVLAIIFVLSRQSDHARPAPTATAAAPAGAPVAAAAHVVAPESPAAAPAGGAKAPPAPAPAQPPGPAPEPIEASDLGAKDTPPVFVEGPPAKKPDVTLALTPTIVCRVLIGVDGKVTNAKV